MNRVLGPAFLLVGLGLVGYAAITLSTAARRARSWSRTTGTVVDSRHDGRDADTVILRLQVRFDAPQGSVTFWNRYGSNVGVRAGTSVDVWYNPDDATEAVIAGGAHGAVPNGLFFLLLGGLVAAVGAAVTWFAYR